MAEQSGVEMKRPSHLPLTRLAHEAAAWAREQGRFEDFHRALFRAQFIEERDLGELETLKGIARDLGMNAGDLGRALTERRMADEVDEDLLIGQSYGVRGVPAYVIGGQILFGVQAASTLIEAIERASRMEPAPKPGVLPSIPINITRK